MPESQILIAEVGMWRDVEVAGVGLAERRRGFYRGVLAVARA